ncbi:DNA-binding response regulator [Alteromonas sp. KUL42]|uniref:response regulator transcription factor n=1 Tax=Alteromonas sp. KUL42 TaxID=2480797 RepID=UPI001036B93B|nr:response regulator transcription factor [Alteromonas sp. KUL42]TAP32238.1 response regulator transcription factor [Alteromonas sp. KUL42]GEA08858.1 DNA-binding response regulator [Alteromonas sp. KUL42]
MIRVLLVEDDLGLAGNIIDYLELENMVCDHAANGVAALSLIQKHPFDVVVLDINLPRLDGLSVCEKVRDDGNDTPIIMLTARDQLENKLEGFQKGADDYLVKPFDMPELVARVQALSHRRSSQIKKLSFGNVSLEVGNEVVNVESTPIKLSPTAFTLLKALLQKRGRVMPRARLVEAVWGEDAPESNALKVHLHNLRKSLVNANANIEVKAIASTGFCLVIKPEQATNVDKENQLSQTNNQGAD